MKIDLDGNVVDERRQSQRVNAAGFTIHSAIHMAREDLMCVVHTHTAAGIAVSAQKQGLLPISQHALKFYGHLAYHGYEGIALDLDERDRLVADLGPHKAMILRNHGLLVAGRIDPRGVPQIYYAGARVPGAGRGTAGGAELILPPKEVCEHTAAQFNRALDDHLAMDAAWTASLRLIDDDRPDYRS